MKPFIFVSLLFVGALAYRASAIEQTNVDEELKGRIYVGQSVREATTILDRLKLRFGEGGFAFAMIDHDRSNLYIEIDPNHSFACVYYSKSKAEITGIHMVYFTSRKQRSKSEPMVPAKEIVFNSDASYNVQFSPPTTEDELDKLEKVSQERNPPRLPSPR